MTSAGLGYSDRMSQTNVLTQPWSGPYGGVPPWDRVSVADFPAAFDEALDDERAAVEQIVRSAAPPDFENTVAALERSGHMKLRVLRLFNVMRLNVSTPEYRALDREWQPRLAAASDAITFFPGLFERIDAVYRSLPAAGLTDEQKRLVTVLRDAFVRSGAKLGPADRERLSAVNQELALLYAEFRAKVLADENTWTLLTAPDDLAGLPAGLVSAAAEAARERGLHGWAILNTRSSVDPFLTFSARRAHRETVWKRFKSRGDNGDSNDTNGIIVRIVRLRAERAALIGYPSHAHWQMADSMAGTPDRAGALLMQVWPAAVARVRDEVAQMQAFASRERGGLRIEPWDYLYYAELVRHGIDRHRHCAAQSVPTGARTHARRRHTGRPNSAMASTSGKLPAPIRCAVPTCAYGRSATCRLARTAACSTSIPSRAAARGRAPGRPAIANGPGWTADRRRLPPTTTTS